MNIGELFVRVTGDTSDFTQKMGGAQKSLSGFEGSAKSATLHTGKLGNAFEGLASRIAGVPPVVGKVAGVMSEFAVGASLTVGILAGVAAVAVAFDVLTASSRKAMEAGDKLIETYNQAARISLAGGQQKADLETINKGLEEHNKWLGAIIQLRIRLGSLGGILGGAQGEQSDKIAAGATAVAQARQQIVNAIGLQDAKDNEAWAKRIKDTNDKAVADAKKAQADFLAGTTSTIAVFDNLTTRGFTSSAVNQKLIDDYKKIAEQIRQMGSDSGPATAELMKLRDALAANLIVAQAIALANSTGTVGPLVGKTLPGVSVTPGALPTPGPMSHVGGPEPVAKVETAIERQTRLDDEHQQRLRGTIANTAAQIASVVGNAVLAVGGSGRGSQIGAAIGGAAGSGIGGLLGASAAGAIGGLTGAAVGSVIPVVGTIIGSVIGSALGGLFDHHKKAVDNNTRALNALTNAVLNAPTGYKLDQNRYDATQGRRIYDAAAQEAVSRSRRGGAQVLAMGV